MPPSDDIGTTGRTGTVIITGASGTLGTALLARAPDGPRRLRAISRHPPSAESGGGVDWYRADLATGAGVDVALGGVQTIIHAASDPGGDTQRTDVVGTRDLLAAAKRAGVQHFIYVSIVGIDRVPVAYYAHKLAAERLVEAGDVPFTILRCTQFFDYMDVLVRRMTRFPIALVPRGFKSQPIHVGEYADALWESVAAGPHGRAPDVAGPEVLTLATMVQTWLTAHRRPVRLLQLPIPGRVAAAMRRGDATAPARAVGRMTWTTWLQQHAARGQEHS